MYRERRALRRVRVDIPAKLLAAPGLPLRDCRLLDISEQGARVEIENTDQVPDEFTLLLTPSGVPQRRCRMIWRTPTHVGVEFENPISATVWQAATGFRLKPHAAVWR
jgi:hypothetical protein